jgi:hypothetical protein
MSGTVTRSEAVRTSGPTWADMGRTGATGIASFLSPYTEAGYRERALAHAPVIGWHPQSFPDTHGSPAMGMACAALAANIDSVSFRKLMDANRWWFTMAHSLPRRQLLLPAQPRQRQLRFRRTHDRIVRRGVHHHDHQTQPADHRQRGDIQSLIQTRIRRKDTAPSFFAGVAGHPGTKRMQELFDALRLIFTPCKLGPYSRTIP